MTEEELEALAETLRDAAKQAEYSRAFVPNNQYAFWALASCTHALHRGGCTRQAER